MKFDKKAVIFDLDGVICFTDKYHYQAWKALSDRLGIDGLLVSVTGCIRTIFFFIIVVGSVFVLLFETCQHC